MARSVLRLKEACRPDACSESWPTVRSPRSCGGRELLGGRAGFRWALATGPCAAGAVILGFGVYHGGNRYTAHFELFAQSLRLPREDREAAIASFAQRYAARLEHYVRGAPYNWFNFYDYWQQPADHESAAG